MRKLVMQTLVVNLVGLGVLLTSSGDIVAQGGAPCVSCIGTCPGNPVEACQSLGCSASAGGCMILACHYPEGGQTPLTLLCDDIT